MYNLQRTEMTAKAIELMTVWITDTKQFPYYASDRIVKSGNEHEALEILVGLAGLVGLVGMKMIAERYPGILAAPREVWEPKFQEVLQEIAMINVRADTEVPDGPEA